MQTISIRQRFRGCLLGLAVGDAVGTTVEFKPRGTFAPVTDMIGQGPFSLKAGEWTPADRARLRQLVKEAHRRHLWIRFYTLNGHEADNDQGWSKGYNFGTLKEAQVRWAASRAAGVDYLATDQYEELAKFNAR